LGDPDQGKGLAGLSNKYSIKVSEWFRLATAQWGAVLGPMIGYQLLYFLIGVIGALIPFVGALILLLVLPPLGAGFYIVPLAQLKGRRWTFGDFFGGFRRYWTILGNALLVGLIVLACLLPGLIAVIAAAPPPLANQAPDEALPQTDPLFGAALIFLFLNLLGAAYVSLRCCIFSMPLILNRGCGPVQAIRGSWTLSKGHFWGLLGVVLLLALINFGGALLCGVGLLFTFPLTQLVLMAGYLSITGIRPPIAGASAGMENG
jgi:hypothetical protein